jgi:hypothetical protein
MNSSPIAEGRFVSNYEACHRINKRFALLQVGVMLTENRMVWCGILGIAIGFIAVADCGAQSAGTMGKSGMGMMDCCGMMGGGQKKAAEDCHKLTMEC